MTTPRTQHGDVTGLHDLPARGTRRGGDDQLRTATWSANDLSLAPGESQTITATYARRDLHGDRPVVTVGGRDVATTTLRG